MPKAVFQAFEDELALLRVAADESRCHVANLRVGMLGCPIVRRISADETIIRLD